MEENRQMQNLDDKVQQFENELKKKREAARMEQSKEAFDNKLGELADLAIEYTQTRGPQDSITMMLVTFLDVALRMQEVMTSVQAISVAMNCVTEAIQFLDSANDMDAAMMEGTLEHKYGFFAMMKQRRQHRRVIRNHRNRMRQFAKGMQSKFRMAQEMVRVMESFAGSLQKSVSKKKKGKAGDTAVSSAAARFMQERAASQGIEIKPAGVQPDVAPDAAGGDVVARYGDIFSK